ncbi:hypothetical protein ACHAXS_013008 [Conticribra weissflogii]
MHRTSHRLPRLFSKISQISEEILCIQTSGDECPYIRPASASEAWSQIHRRLVTMGLVEKSEIDVLTTISRETQYQILSTLLCRAVSNECDKQNEYVQRIKDMTDRPDVQHEIMRIIQQSQQIGDGESYDGEEDQKSDHQSTLMDESVLDESAEFGFDFENGGKEISRVDETWERRFNDEVGADDFATDSLQERKRRRAEVDESFLEEMSSDRCRNQELLSELLKLREDNEILKRELEETRQREHALTEKVDEMELQHRAEMLRLESESIETSKLCENKCNRELCALKNELENLREYKQSSDELKEEVTRLRDELDVAQFSKDKLVLTEEQLRKCREKIELMGDAQEALEREEKAHAASVEKCIALENELVTMKTLKRQLEEYKVRADEAEVTLEECRDDLRRLQEKNSGLEGDIKALKRGISLQHAETGDFQKRLQDEGGNSLSGSAVGVGMSELNPELLEELMTLRSEYARLKEFESKREVDEVQRLEESCDDARRLSDKFKERFFQTKSELERTQKLLRESEEREQKLKNDVADWSRRYQELDEKMKEERLKSHKAAIDAERDYQNQKKNIMDKARQELIALEEKLTMKIDSERKQHKEKLDIAELEKNGLEQRLSRQLSALRDESAAALRSQKEAAQKRFDEFEKSKQTELDAIMKAKAEEIESLLVKGKEMLRQSKKKATAAKEELVKKYEATIDQLEEELQGVKSFQQQYEQKAKAKISKRDSQIKILETKHQEALRLSYEWEEKAKKAARNSKEISADNDRLRRQLGRRFGPGGASQTQVDELMSVCNSLREENRRLREINISGGTNHNEAFSEDAHYPKSSTAPISKSALVQYREEFEERIRELEDEKRDLIMRNTAAITDVQKAEQRSWDLEQELEKLRSELTTAKLSMERNQFRNSTPNIRKRGLPPSGGLNKSKALSGASSGEIANNPGKENSTPNTHKRQPSGTKAAPLPTLMDYTSTSHNKGASENPECKQS